jgi:allophanate hydrolase subunit 1
MTRVQVNFHLRKPLEESEYHSIAQAHATYGIEKITLAPGMQDVKVEYDATRLRPAEVEAILATAGIPIA